MNPGLSEEQELSQLLASITQPLQQKNIYVKDKPKVIVISGPTAVGKTKLSLSLAQVLGGEIVSADSMQVYRNMDIGTAKVGIKERAQVPHHLIDIRDVKEPFNVMDFYKEATKAIRSILARNRVPIVVGGTGFYIHALLYGPPQGPTSVPEIREQIEKEMDQLGPNVLFERLKTIDPDYAATITQADRQKIVRGLEITKLTNKKVSDFPKADTLLTEFHYRGWFLHKPKEILYPLIEMRCDEMIANGLIEEVSRLEKEGLRENSSASQAIGYRQVLDFLDSGGSPEDFERFVASFKRASRRYAKRQFTWFKKEPVFHWLDMHTHPPERALQAILQDYELSL